MIMPLKDYQGQKETTLEIDIIYQSLSFHWKVQSIYDINTTGTVCQSLGFHVE